MFHLGVMPPFKFSTSSTIPWYDDEHFTKFELSILSALFGKLLMKIPDLRTLNTLHSEKLLGRSSRRSTSSGRFRHSVQLYIQAFSTSSSFAAVTIVNIRMLSRFIKSALESVRDKIGFGLGFMLGLG